MTDATGYPNVNERIAERRQQLGLSDIEVAERTGLSIHEYGDLEQHAEEPFEVVPLGRLRAVCDTLKLSLAELLPREMLSCERSEASISLHEGRRNAIVEARRKKLELSRQELGDRLGFPAETVKLMEEDPDFLERWPIGYVRDVARELGIPLHVLLGLPCPDRAES